MQNDTPIRIFRGIGEARAAMFVNLGINTAEDLLYFFPKRYENRGAISTIEQAPEVRFALLL